LQALATTTIIGDVVGQVGGELVEVRTLLPPGADPHTFEPAPQDAASAADASLVFANGAGLEPFMGRLGLDPQDDRVVMLSDGLELLQLDPSSPEADETGGLDPHVWFDPNNVIAWTDTIAQALGQADPANAGQYRQNAGAYQAELRALDAWIQQQVEQVPPENRKLVTDHLVFGYFAARYGFEQVGAVIPGFSTAAGPSAQELAALEARMIDQGVPAIFVGATANPDLAQRVAEDTGVRLVTLPTESGDYLELMRSAVGALVEALK
jgi:ABC-type Zn uptake system ZnuABC Zn-binding protein ZnuA